MTKDGGFYTSIVPDVFSEWHCHKACNDDVLCAIFSWSYQKSESIYFLKTSNRYVKLFLIAVGTCALLGSLPDQNSLIQTESWISGVANCTNAASYLGNKYLLKYVINIWMSMPM